MCVCVDNTHNYIPPVTHAFFLFIRALIDKAMPSVDYGKGCTLYTPVAHTYIQILLIHHVDRVGSEFWNQQVRIGNDVTGIK